VPPPLPLNRTPLTGDIVGLPVLNGLHHDYQHRAA
jgi:hypothetical protein